MENYSSNKNIIEVFIKKQKEQHTSLSPENKFTIKLTRNNFIVLLMITRLNN